MTFLEKILTAKREEVAAMEQETLRPIRETYSFYDYLQAHPERMQLIGEVKRASPSKGAIKLDVDPIEQALAYERAGVAAISVLTDPSYFKGSIEDLRQVASRVSIPVLCKDFIIDEKQISRANNAGATIILLIVAALEAKRLEELYRFARSIGLEVLVEVHNEQELETATKLGATIIGVNNRNLHSFEVDIAVSEMLATKRAASGEKICYISESGFKTPEDVERVKQDYRAVLVGEALMLDDQPEKAAERLRVLR